MEAVYKEIEDCVRLAFVEFEDATSDGRSTFELSVYPSGLSEDAFEFMHSNYFNEGEFLISRNESDERYRERNRELRLKLLHKFYQPHWTEKRKLQHYFRKSALVIVKIESNFSLISMNQAEFFDSILQATYKIEGLFITLKEEYEVRLVNSCTNVYSNGAFHTQINYLIYNTYDAIKYPDILK